MQSNATEKGVVLLHLSDIHFGPPLVPGAPAELAGEVRRHAPDLVVVSGDLTQRAKPRQFRAAAVFLRGLGVPYLSVPGNHDIPLYPVHRRIFTPYRQYRRNVCDEREPTALVGESTVVVGFDTTAPYLIVEGHAAPFRIGRWERRLAALPKDRIRIAVAHHPVLAAGDGEEKHLLRGARAFAGMLARNGFRLLLGGHLHVGFLEDAAVRWPEAAGLLVVQSGTSGSDRGRHPDHGARGYGVVRVGPRSTVVERWRNEGRGFEMAENRTSPRGADDPSGGRNPPSS